MSHAPALSKNSASALSACFINELLVEKRVDVTPCNAAFARPAKKSFPVMLHEKHMRALDIARDGTKGCKKFFSCDGDKKHVPYHKGCFMVESFSRDHFLLDSDAAAGTNVENVEAIDTSLTKMDSSIDYIPK